MSKSETVTNTLLAPMSFALTTPSYGAFAVFGAATSAARLCKLVRSLFAGHTALA